MKASALLFPSLIALIAANAGAAQAQDVGEAFKRDRNISVLERPHPEYRPVGIRSGSFLISPVLTAGVGYDSNVFATPSAKGDAMASLAGVLNVASDWSTHSLGLRANLRHDAYNDFSRESRTTYGLSANGRIDGGRDLAFIGSAGYQRQVEDRTNSGALLSDKPIRYDQFSASLGGARAFNRLRLTGAYAFDRYNYRNGTIGGTPLPQDYRDHDHHQLSLRGDYAVSPATALFLEGRYDDRRYDKAISPALTRDSDGYEVTAGADFEIGGLARGKAQLGYLRQDLAAPGVRDVAGLGGRAEVQLFPTQLITVTVRAARVIADTGQLAAPALSATSVGGQADYELRRNIILSARLDYEDDAFRGVDRKDQRLSGSLGGTYLLNRGMGVSLLYSHLSQDSSGLSRGPDFDVDRITASLVLRR